MKFIAEIEIMPHKELLDPQGKAVAAGLHRMELNVVKDVRIGKHIRLQLEADNRDAAATAVETACSKLLANPIMESYSYDIQEA